MTTNQMKTEDCERDAGTLGHWDTGTGDGEKVGREEAQEARKNFSHESDARDVRQQVETQRREGEFAFEPYIDKREVARRMGRGVRAVESMMRRGMIPYYKLGYRVAFRWSEIQSHLAETCRVVRTTDHGPRDH